MIPLIFVASATVMSTWSMISVSLLVARRDGREPERWARWCWAELRPFFLPANAGFVVAGYLVSPATLGGSAIALPLGLLVWHFCKDIDDDRWKRRKAKLAEKVARKGDRLVVVRVAAGAR